MKHQTLYGISLALTILLTLVALITLLAWVGTLIHGIGRLPVIALIPWNTLGLLVLAAANCTLRAELIVRKRQLQDETLSQE